MPAPIPARDLEVGIDDLSGDETLSQAFEELSPDIAAFLTSLEDLDSVNCDEAEVRRLAAASRPREEVEASAVGVEEGLRVLTLAVGRDLVPPTSAVVDDGPMKRRERVLPHRSITPATRSPDRTNEFRARGKPEAVFRTPTDVVEPRPRKQR